MIAPIPVSAPLPARLRAPALPARARWRHALACAALACLTWLGAAGAPAQAQGAAQDSAWATQLHDLAGSFAADQDISAEWAWKVLSQARHNGRVKRLMTPSAQKAPTVRDWQAYRERLITAARIEAGMAFWRRHQQQLQDIEAFSGVPASVIVGIIGIETTYGQNMGSIRVLDALATLAFDYPSNHPRAFERSQFFRKELEQFLRLCHSNDLDPLTLQGSFAGAMGVPQFMPSSWRLYGRDGNEDGVVDLISSPQDAIASVANYLLAHGWRARQPAYLPVALQAQPEQLRALLAPDILPTFDQATLQQLGALPQPAGTQYDGLMALVELKNGARAPEYILGTENFYAVTRYNQSSYYALAVLQLGEAVQQRMQQLQPQRPPAPKAQP